MTKIYIKVQKNKTLVELYYYFEFIWYVMLLFWIWQHDVMNPALGAPPRERWTIRTYFNFNNQGRAF